MQASSVRWLQTANCETEDPDTLAWMYVSPIIVLLSICDRQPEREAESLEKLDAHVKLFFRTFNIVGGEK